MVVTSAVVLASVPQGAPRPEHFALAATPLPSLQPGELLVRVRTLSLDPYLRSMLGGRHLDDSPVAPGDVVPGRSIGEVVESRDTGVPAGALVLAETGWREAAVVVAASATVLDLPVGVPTSAALGALGMPGLTAYAAHVRHLRPEPGETVVVGAGTGGVGAVAGQLARAAGARTVAVVGSAEKAALATERLGYAATVRRGTGLTEALRQVCPHGIDGYLHLGDQATLDAVMEHLAVGARVSLCGLMDQYNGAAPTRLRAGAVMAARAEVRGMVVHDHHDLAVEHVRRVGELLVSGELVALEDRYTGLAQAPLAFARLMSGQNTGKVVVDLTA